MLRFNFNVCDNYKFLKRNLNLISTRNLRELRYRSIHDKKSANWMLKLLIKPEDKKPVYPVLILS